MPADPRRQPLRAGFTAAELVVGLATGGLIALVVALLFRAGLVTYRYTVRQGEFLAAARQTIHGDGAVRGFTQVARVSKQVTTLAGSLPVFLSTSSVQTSFYLSGTDLLQSDSTQTYRQAVALSTFSVAYYRLNDSGLIVQSTYPAGATLVTVSATLTRNYAKEKQMTFYSGAMMRNHP